MVARRKRFVTKQVTVPEAFARYCADFNSGRFYEAHEHLEEIWQFEHGPVRDLYKALIQAAAAYVHLQRGRYPGASRLLRTALGYLEPYRPGPAMGFDTEGIWRALDGARELLEELGPGGVERFPLAQRPVMDFDASALPAEARRWRAWGFDEEGRPLAMDITVPA
ncbi:DUF309 domain-containing protein [Tepidiforma thermophila]|uniref:Putative metal-dependent hydrolase n=1 Tax=Tepidiforma thermophila (strain KCTC 52669 / CGMCC 1.13589 / G233) TaxID=2761530 RepID=A0A2A9HHJ8_TEPT2|nr:DUF309 domain-containing protein [Tepidiforma thermophila]PFG74612.1 putative metal-dependent hydrolase [Tepidiforma thermophila]